MIPDRRGPIGETTTVSWRRTRARERIRRTKNTWRTESPSLRQQLRQAKGAARSRTQQVLLRPTGEPCQRFTVPVAYHTGILPRATAEQNTVQCTIHEVRVNPCREAEERKPCSLKKGQDASISFDYTPQFNGSLFSRAYWASEIVDLPFLGMPIDACPSTTCPASPGQKQTYSVVLPISKKFPTRTYDLKWRLWNEQEQECCFMFQIKLVK
ncbi:PREDICTED: MD-2-related lipid-recognition protein-like [Atta cephalotes]|uniref:MD-2-related lipid-recognition domain-containing protein n=1 Tax=Atta cephalotes TaxID=12957 RepID=A0A158NQ68_ATTCE|nr:PREDICTED: MD-2-related lipid-recognition protein-like [Atta cephalotes]